MGSFRYANTCEPLLVTSLEGFQMDDAFWQNPASIAAQNQQAAPLDLKQHVVPLSDMPQRSALARAKLLHIIGHISMFVGLRSHNFQC